MMTSRIENTQLIIDYTAGIDGYSECILINSMGEQVGKPLQRVDREGNYRIQYSLENLSNGVYNIYFRSGFYTQKQCIIYVR